MKSILGTSLALFCSSAAADALSTPEQTKEIRKKTVTLSSNGKISESFNILKPRWPLPTAELDNLTY